MSMVNEWEHNKKWLEDLRNNKVEQIYKGTIYFPVTMVEMYPLNESDLTILSGLGFYKDDFGYGSKDKAPYLKIKYFVLNFIDENSEKTKNGYIDYNFSTRELARAYIGQNENSDFRFSIFMVGLLDSAIKKI